MTNKDDDYLNVSEKEKMIKKKDEFFNRLFNLNEDTPDREKGKFILSILDYIADLDLRKTVELWLNSFVKLFGGGDYHRHYLGKVKKPKKDLYLTVFFISMFLFIFIYSLVSYSSRRQRSSS